MNHAKTHEQLELELENAKKIVKIGGIYSHYKNPDNHYKVLSLGFREETDKLCVIYLTEYGKKLTFVRDLDSWSSKPTVNGVRVNRFKLLK